MFTASEVLAVYEEHPLRLETLRSRLEAQGRRLGELTELDLAVDPESGITDQNHIGGIEFVEQMAREVGVSPTSRVLDVGCGLGGSSRYLAYRYGCHVVGIELSPKRCADARELTRLVRLEHLVSVRCGDALEMEFARERYDIVWGQSAWVHIPDKERLIARMTTLLTDRGTIAFEDSCLLRQCADEAEGIHFEALQDAWRSELVPLSVWSESLRRAGLQRIDVTNLTATLINDCDRFLAMHTSGLARFPEVEVRGWTEGKRLAEAGLIGYLRVVARREPSG